jgi:hypothetical protein
MNLLLCLILWLEEKKLKKAVDFLENPCRLVS